MSSPQRMYEGIHRVIIAVEHAESRPNLFGPATVLKVAELKSNLISEFNKTRSLTQILSRIDLNTPAALFAQSLAEALISDEVHSDAKKALEKTLKALKTLLRCGERSASQGSIVSPNSNIDSTPAMDEVNLNSPAPNENYAFKNMGGAIYEGFGF